MNKNSLTGRVALLIDAVTVLGGGLTPFIGPLRPENWEEWP